MSDLVKTQHMSGELIRRLDRELGEAIGSVEDEKVSKASVTLSFDVGRDEKSGDVIVVFNHKRGDSQKGSYEPARQARLPLDDDDTRVTISAGGRPGVTVTGRQFARAAEAVAGGE